MSITQREQNEIENKQQRQSERIVERASEKRR